MLAHAMGRGDALQARVPALTAAVGYAHVAQPTFSERPMDGRLGGHHGFGGSLLRGICGTIVGRARLAPFMARMA